MVNAAAETSDDLVEKYLETGDSGMQSFDQSLMQLVRDKLVTYEEALKHVTNPDDFALRFRGIGSTSDGTWEDFEDSPEGLLEVLSALS